MLQLPFMITGFFKNHEIQKKKKYKCRKINLRDEFSIFFLSYFLRVFLWSLGWPGTHCVGQAGTEFWILLSQPPRENRCTHHHMRFSLSFILLVFKINIVTWQFHKVYNVFWLLPPSYPPSYPYKAPFLSPAPPFLASFGVLLFCF